MRIAVLASNPGTGLLFYPVRLALTFRKLGHEVKAYTWTNIGQTPGLAEQLQEAGVEIEYRPELEFTGIRGLAASLTSSPRPLKDTVDLLLTFGPMGAWQLARLLEADIRAAMIEAMGHDRRSFWKPRIGAMLLNRYCDKVGALCHLEKQRLETAGVRPDKLLVIHNPVDWRSFAEINSDRDSVLNDFGLCPDYRYVGCLANFQPRKRQDLLLRAFSKISEEFSDVHIIFCGEGGELPKCRELSRRLGLDSRTHFLGRIVNSDALRLTASLDAFAVISNAETFGYSFVEPLLFSKPTLVTRVAIGWEMDQAGVAVVISPDNEHEVVEGLRRILNNDDDLNRMTAKGPAFVRELFDTEIIARKLISLAETSGNPAQVVQA